MTQTDQLSRFTASHRWTYMMDEPTAAAFGRRWTRAVDIAAENIEPAGENCFIVQSSKADGSSYAVRPELGCSCPDTAGDSIRYAPFGWCKHRLAVWMLTDLESPVPPRPTFTQDQIDMLFKAA